MNCCVAPTVTVGFAGDTAIELSVEVAAVTVTAAVPLTPLCEAVTVVEPAAAAVTIPEVLTPAMLELAVAQEAVEVTSPVVPSEYVPVAVNCCVPPTAILAVAGETAMVCSVFCPPVEPEPEEQPAKITASVVTARASEGTRAGRRRLFIVPRGDSGAELVIGQRGGLQVGGWRRRDLLWRLPGKAVHLLREKIHKRSQLPSAKFKKRAQLISARMPV